MKLILFILPLFFISLVFAQGDYYNETEPGCEEELQLLLNEYNNLTEDYHSGVNCGTVRYLLIDNNHKLSDNLKTCNQDLGEYKVYRTGFYFLFIVNLLLIFYHLIILIINHRREK